MIQTDSTFSAKHEAKQKQPLYYLEIDEVDVAWAGFSSSVFVTVEIGSGYGVQGYGLVGYGF